MLGQLFLFNITACILPLQAVLWQNIVWACIIKNIGFINMMERKKNRCFQVFNLIHWINQKQNFLSGYLIFKQFPTEFPENTLSSQYSVVLPHKIVHNTHPEILPLLYLNWVQPLLRVIFLSHMFTMISWCLKNHWLNRIYLYNKLFKSLI